MKQTNKKNKALLRAATWMPILDIMINKRIQKKQHIFYDLCTFYTYIRISKSEK